VLTTPVRLLILILEIVGDNDNTESSNKFGAEMILRIIKFDGENVFEIILSALIYVIPLGLIASIVVNPTGFSDFATKFPPIKSIMCSNIKSEIAANDEIGRDLWNAYQTEVSSLANREEYSNYQSKVANVARRANQLLVNDSSGLMRMREKEHCVKDLAKLEEALNRTNQTIRDVESFITGYRIDWNKNFYSFYGPNSSYLK